MKLILPEEGKPSLRQLENRFRDVFEALERVADAYGWSLAAGYKTQDDPEQYPLILTHEPRAKGPLGARGSDHVTIEDLFGHA
jgi:hypothetical protein